MCIYIYIYYVCLFERERGRQRERERERERQREKIPRGRGADRRGPDHLPLRQGLLAEDIYVKQCTLICVYLYTYIDIAIHNHR